MQHAAARLVVRGAKKFDNITPVLQSFIDERSASTADTAGVQGKRLYSVALVYLIGDCVRFQHWP